MSACFLQIESLLLETTTAQTWPKIPFQLSRFFLTPNVSNDAFADQSANWAKFKTLSALEAVTYWLVFVPDGLVRRKL